MKKSFIRLIKVISLLLLIIVIDKFTGKILGHLYKTSTDDTISKIRYTYYQTNEDILIFGASTAQHHYIPDTISKGTELTAFNCGIGGEPLAFSLIQISETLKRYEPKIIILDIPIDIYDAKDFDPRLNVLNPYYHNNILIRRILTNNGSKFEKLKYTSSIYPYNGMIADMLLSLVYHPNVSIKGFIRIYGSKLDANSVPHEEPWVHKEIPAKQMEYLQEITNLCQKHHVDFWIIISPVYKTTRNQLDATHNLRIFAKEHNIHFLDFSQNSNLSDYLLFRDNLHLNINGAIKYSRMVRDSIFCSISNYK